MNRIDRLLGILTLLQTRKYVPAEMIAERFNISVRTVYRDVKALSEQGVPLSFEPGRGYFVVQGYFLPPVSFSSEEAHAVLLMEAVMQGFSDRTIRRHYSNALQKIKAVLRGTQKDSVEALDANIRFQVPACFRHDFEYLSLLQQCIAGKTVVEIGYEDSKQQVSRRLVEPIGLVFYAFGWHLIGWCQLRQDYRDFKVARIRSAANTQQQFCRDHHISLDEYMKQLPVAY